MSKSPRALQELMTAVDAGLVDSDTDSAPWRRPSRGRGRKSAPVVVEERASSDTSFEFSAAVSYSSASPASMVFSDGQLRAHQFPAVRSSADSSQAASPVRRASSAGSCGISKQQAGAAAGSSKKRVSFATDGGDDKAAAAPAKGKRSGGLLGCMGSACGPSPKDAVEPARNANRKVSAV
ncbi:hypothetical protein BS78_01G168100 [Paspalum vaginatum]|nr:hypothetical protein BS78_01G168100 [Paspalum vaginatum]